MPVIFIPSPYFPPSAFPVAQRVRLLIRHFNKFNWKPVIFTINHRYREELADPWMVEITGNQFEKVDVDCLDQRWTRKFGIGDLGLRIFPFLFFNLLKEAKKRKPDFILYPVPPWNILIMAPWVKRITGVPYAIDFIDPWVHKSPQKNIKSKVSQWVARRFQRLAVKHSSAVFAVSQGILDDLVNQYTFIKNKPLVAVPYGVELSDFAAIKTDTPADGPFMIRYVGAISAAMMPVAETLIKALVLVQKQIPIRVEFTGTSYAGTGMIKPALDSIINENQASSFIMEYPERVGYHSALELGMNATMQLLIGDTTLYYAASKLMGLAGSGKPFFAFVLKNSFPANFLKDANFESVFEFESISLSNHETVKDLAKALYHSIIKSDKFKPIPIDNPLFKQHTAEAMTKIFSDTLNDVSG